VQESFAAVKLEICAAESNREEVPDML